MTSGFEGTIREMRNPSQAYVKLDSGEIVVPISDLKFLRKRKK